jgi:integrase
MASRITKALVDRMRPGDQHWDSELKGFGVRCQGSIPSFMLKTRVNGRQRWMQIGKHGSPWTVETARREALRLLSAAQHGTDLVKEQQQATSIALVEAANTLTFADLAARYLTEHGPKLKPRTREEYARLVKNTLTPRFAAHSMTAITKSDISQLHSSLAATPRKANFAIAVLSAIFNWSQAQNLVPEGSANPCIKLKKYKESSRERYLNKDEIAHLFAVLDDIDRAEGTPLSATTAIRLLLLTGARLNEVLTLKWVYVDIERTSLWLPDSKTGKKAIHLNPQALEILARAERVSGNPYVIPGEQPKAHLVNLQKPWRRIRAMAGLDDVRIHDLRHSYASIAINAGASLSMVGKLLGHRQPQTTMRYAHLADDPLRDLNNRIGASIAKAASSKSDAD